MPKAPSRCYLNITFCLSADKSLPRPISFDLIEEVLDSGESYAKREYTDIQPNRPARFI